MQAMIKRTLLGVLFAAAPAILTAQQSAAVRAPRRAPLTVVLVRQLPRSDASYQIQRRTFGNDRDVVLLLDSATPEQLSDAIRGVMTARQAGGDSATQAATFRVRPQATAGTGRAAFRWAARVLSDLSAAQARDVPGVGRVRAVVIGLPPHTRVHRRAS